MNKTANTVSENDERTAPAHWASPLVNDDYSGIEDEAEVARIKEFATDLAAEGWSIVGASDDTDIQVFEGLQTECIDIQIMRDKVQSLVDGDTFTVTRQTDGRVAPTPIFSGSIAEVKAALPALAEQGTADAWIYLERVRDGRKTEINLPTYTMEGVVEAVEKIAPTPKLTLASVKAELAAVGIAVTKNDDELRVNFKGGTEDHAYYAYNIDGKPDYADALATGKSMAAWKVETTEKFGAGHEGLKGTGPAFEPKLDGIERAAEAFAESLAGPVMATALERVAKEGISIEQALGESMAAAADMSLSALEAEEREIAGFDAAEADRDYAAEAQEIYAADTKAWEAETGIVVTEALYAAEAQEAMAERQENWDFYGDVTEWGERPTSTLDPRVARLQKIKAAEATMQPTDEQTRGRAR